MRCPRCYLSDNTAVLRTRHRADGSIRRRHECVACRIRWTSTEEITLGSIRSAAASAAVDRAEVPCATDDAGDRS
jgi:transcriptional regulator NrdR family protein